MKILMKDFPKKNNSYCLLGIIISFLFFSQQAFAQDSPMIKKQEKTYVQGIVKVMSLQCVDSESDIHSQAIPLVKEKFKIVKGNKYSGQQPVGRFITGENGNYQIQLLPGTYSIVEDSRTAEYSPKKKEGKYIWDTLCLGTKWSEPIVSFEIGLSDPVTLNFTVTKK